MACGHDDSTINIVLVLLLLLLLLLCVTMWKLIADGRTVYERPYGDRRILGSPPFVVTQGHWN